MKEKIFTLLKKENYLPFTYFTKLYFVCKFVYNIFSPELVKIRPAPQHCTELSCKYSIKWAVLRVSVHEAVLWASFSTELSYEYPFQWTALSN